MGNTRALAATIVALTVIVFGRPSPALADDAELVIEWNRVLFSVVGSAPPTRPAAMLHIAMFDAVNAIEDAYTPYRFEVRASRGASEEAAGAQAAHDVLTALFPSQRATFDAVLAVDLAGIPPGRLGAALREVDRRQAIQRACEESRPGDVLLIAGKGHETTQTIGSRVLPFDDRAVAREVLWSL